MTRTKPLHSRLGLTFALALWTLALALPAAIAAPQSPADEMVSPIAPETPPFASQVEPLRELPEAPSRGDCAPQYRNGLSGTCIDDQPCRGFGVVDPKRGPICRCFDVPGGCAADQRCERRGAQCVKDEEGGSDRLR